MSDYRITGIETGRSVSFVILKDENLFANVGPRKEDAKYIIKALEYFEKEQGE